MTRRTVFFSLVWIVCVAGIIGFAAMSAWSDDRFWVGNSGLWSDTAHWSVSSGGGGSAGVPGSSDNVYFDANSAGSATVDVSFAGTILSLTLTNGYTGTNTQMRDLTVNSDCLIGGGAWRFTSGSNAALTVGNNMMVSNAVVYCQYSSANGSGTGRTFTVGGNLTLTNSGSINAVGLGFNNTQGPAASSANSMGSHGGDGADRQGTTYGSITQPVSLGGAGYNTFWGNRNGGGAIKLVVTGATTLDAGSRITADGLNNSGNIPPSAGGSVFLRTATLTGNGTISAKGGSDGTFDGSGGGRIAIWLTSGTDFGGVTNIASGGSSGAGKPGAAGTIYLQTSAQVEGQGTLIVNNANLLPDKATTMMVPGTALNGFSQIVITNSGNIGIRTNVDFSQANFVGSGRASAYVTIRNPAIGLTFPTNITGNYTLNLDVPVSIPGHFVVATNARLSHTRNTDARTYWLSLSVASNLTIKGQINADARGYAPGKGTGRSSLVANGAGHGGCGGGNDGITDGTTYGSITNPTTLGSGGPDNYWVPTGAGAIKLDVGDVLTVETGALISASSYSLMGVNYNGQGAGGSINIHCGSLAGSGSIVANGASSVDSCGGGGGRIAIGLTAADDFGSLTIQAQGGKRGGTYTNGGAGTIYLKRASDAYGTLIVNTPHAGPTATTLISSSVTDAIVGDVIITNSASLALGSNQTLTVYGNWLNRGAFTGNTNSTVNFSGTSQATVLGSNTFYNFSSTTLGKVLIFESGKTNTVLQGLTLRDVTVNSTVHGQYWYLTLVPGATQSVVRVLVGDSNAGGGQMISGPGFSSGHNVNWRLTGGTMISVK